MPGVFEELLARQRALRDAFGGKLGDDLGLGGYRRVVGARNPQRVLPLHSGAANQNILNRVVQHVPHVEDTRHVGRRYNYRIWLAAIGFGMKQAVLHPVAVPAFFDFVRAILLGKFFHCNEVRVVFVSDGKVS